MRRKSHSTRRSAKIDDPIDDLDIETPRSVVEPIPPIRSGSPVRRTQVIEDRRNWAPRGHPAPSRQAPRDFSGRPARISHEPKKSPRVAIRPGGKVLQARRSVIARVDAALPRFAEARRTVICFKRKVQREVLHALKRTRSGRGARKHRNEWSDIQC